MTRFTRIRLRFVQFRRTSIEAASPQCPDVLHKSHFAGFGHGIGDVSTQQYDSKYDVYCRARDRSRPHKTLVPFGEAGTRQMSAPRKHHRVMHRRNELSKLSFSFRKIVCRADQSSCPVRTEEHWMEFMLFTSQAAYSWRARYTYIFKEMSSFSSPFDKGNWEKVH